MKHVTRLEKAAMVLGRHGTGHESQIDVFVRSINLVSDDGMAEVGEMDPNLVFPACRRRDVQPAERRAVSLESADDFDRGSRGGAVVTDGILDGNVAALIAAERCVDDASRFGRMAMDDGPVFFRDCGGGQQPSKLARNVGVFCDEHGTAGFAIEPVDEPAFGVAQMQTQPADKARQFPVARRMAHEACRFVDDQQGIVFVKNPQDLGPKLLRKDLRP